MKASATLGHAGVESDRQVRLKSDSVEHTFSTTEKHCPAYWYYIHKDKFELNEPCKYNQLQGYHIISLERNECVFIYFMSRINIIESLTRYFP